MYRKYHIVSEDIRRFRRPAPEQINHDGLSTDKGAFKVMGELLEIASWVGTPIGGICAIAFVTAMFFYARWVLGDPKKKETK
jgi:hypothetical protein